MTLPVGRPLLLVSSFLYLVLAGTSYAGGFASGARSLAASPSEPTSSTRQKELQPSPALSVNTVTIPGPLRSFLRMAGISQKIGPDDVLPLLARNVYVEGYLHGRETEFLVLLDRYVQQARAIRRLTDSHGVIRVTDCKGAEPLLQILGYRARPGCGMGNVTLVTSNPESAFLTVDSGFPLTALEEALDKGTPFVYTFQNSHVPVFFGESQWTSATLWKKTDLEQNLIDVLLHDPVLARLYWALAKNDSATRQALQASPGLQRLRPYSAVLDFYGNQIAIRSGRVVVPGGPAAEPEWKSLVGPSPSSAGDFVLRLVSKDNGWLAVYFDSLARVSQAQQAHLTENSRLKRLYATVRESNGNANAADASFRKAPGLLVLFNRIQWDQDGQPRVPGNLAVWQEILAQKTDSKVIHNWAKHGRCCERPEQLLEAMVAFSLSDADNRPLQTYLALSELDSGRPPERRLSPDTVRLLARRYSDFSNWYPVFIEFPDLSDASIVRFVNAADTIRAIPNHPLRGNALGTFQANIGLWQILARQGQIPKAKLNDSWQAMIEPFTRVTSSSDLFDSAHGSLEAIMAGAGAQATCSQDEVIDLLAGPHQDSPEGQRMHAEVAANIRSVMEGQRLVSLDTLCALGEGLKEMAQGTTTGDKLGPLVENLSEFEMPRPMFTNNERLEYAPGAYDNRHAELQVRTELMKLIKAPPSSRTHLQAARGQLEPFLRDTLVGLNYAYYEPPGAQLLHHDPLLVRMHDFTGETVSNTSGEDLWQSSELFNAGTAAAGGAYMIGSLADLPYALALAEQDFIAPENVQALIWKELVPDLLVSATLSRWWGVTPDELHAVTLYQRSGEEILLASATNPALQENVKGVLVDRLGPQRLELLEQNLHSGDRATILAQVTPADTFYLAAAFKRKYPDQLASQGTASAQLEKLCAAHPEETSWERISKDFGVPHPVFAQSYGRELLSVKPFPAFEGSYSRMFGESWDSNNLYWGRLADEMGYSPVMLNRLVPQLTQRMVSKIFATNLEDWPAVSRAMQETAEEFRRSQNASTSPAEADKSSLR